MMFQNQIWMFSYEDELNTPKHTTWIGLNKHKFKHILFLLYP